MFDFSYDERSEYIIKNGFASREASREEVLLWRRVQELEAVFEARCPELVKALIASLQTAWETSHEFMFLLNPEDLAALLQHAPHRVRPPVQAITQARYGVTAEMPVRDDEGSGTLWLKGDLSLNPSEFRSF